jgi:hypothetical protein
MYLPVVRSVVCRKLPFQNFSLTFSTTLKARQECDLFIRLRLGVHVLLLISPDSPVITPQWIQNTVFVRNLLKELASLRLHRHVLSLKLLNGCLSNLVLGEGEGYTKTSDVNSNFGLYRSNKGWRKLYDEA